MGEISMKKLMAQNLFMINYYGIVSIEIIYELYKLKIKDTMDEMIDMPYERAVSW